MKLMDKERLLKELDEFMEIQSEGVTEHRVTLGQAFVAVKHLAANVEAALEGLEVRLQALEAQPLNYAGVYEAGKTYSKGTFVSRQGSIWYCRETTSLQPGGGASQWQLAVKHGADGRDGAKGDKGDKGDRGRDLQ